MKKKGASLPFVLALLCQYPNRVNYNTEKYDFTDDYTNSFHL